MLLCYNYFKYLLIKILKKVWSQLILYINTYNYPIYNSYQTPKTSPISHTTPSGALPKYLTAFMAPVTNDCLLWAR